MDARIHQYRIARWLRRLFVMLTLVTSCGAQASGSVPVQWLWLPQPQMIPVITYSTLDAAAQASAAAWNAAIPPGIRQYITFTGCVENDVTGYGTCIETAYVYTCLAYDSNNKCLQYGDYAYAGPTVMTWGATSACPDNSSFNGTDCTCNVDFVPDPTKTSCVPVDPCPQVKALTPLPSDDACAQTLDNLHTTQAQKDAACGTLSTAMKEGKSCLEKKLSPTPNAANPIPLKVTADIRDLAYQAHLREIWDKMEKLVRLEDDPAKQTACAARRAEIAAEKGCDNAGKCKSCFAESAIQRSHCLKGRPSSSNDAPHTKGNALDVSEASTITPMKKVLKARKPPKDIQQFLDEAPDCKLKWGGKFTDNYDPIHFQVK